MALVGSCEIVTAVVRWIHWIFSGLEEVNLFVTLMARSTVMVDMYLHVSFTAHFVGDDETQQRYTFSSALSTLIARRTS